MLRQPDVALRPAGYEEYLSNQNKLKEPVVAIITVNGVRHYLRIEGDRLPIEDQTQQAEIQRTDTELAPQKKRTPLAFPHFGLAVNGSVWSSLVTQTQFLQ
jgi:hypothetical protein